MAINKNYKLLHFSFFHNTTYKDLDTAISEISKELLVNMPSYKIKNNKIAITSFVNLDSLKETSSFGRVIAESLINDLHVKHFKIIEFRQQNSISVNNSGEFILTRNTDKIVDEIPNSLLLVGTYSILEDKKIVINARIIDNSTLDVISTARVSLNDYKTCKRFNLCNKRKHIIADLHTIKEDCNKFDCQKNNNRDLY
jgi:TolB-like protein